MLLLVASTVGFTAEEKKEQAPLESVEVVASKVDLRQTESAAKFFVTQEDMQKFADKTLSDVLKRVPGVTVDSEVRMRGLGAGYTQILIDGEPAPQGFTIDSLDPSLIERIEVSKTPVAEASTRAIAGTINLILKKHSRRRQKQYKVSAERNQGSLSPGVSWQMSSGEDRFSYQLAASASLQRPVSTSLMDEVQYDEDGAVTVHRQARNHFESKATTLNLTPQVSWKSERNTLSWQGLLQQYELPASWSIDESALFGPLSTYPYSVSNTNHSRTRSARSDMVWGHRIGERDKLDVKLGLNFQKRNADFDFYGSNADHQLQLDRNVISDATESSVTNKGKYLSAIGEEHAFAIGWDGSYVRRSEGRLQQDDSATGDLLYRLDQQYVAQIRQMALFTQDEWSITEKLQAYLGLRWEGLETEITGREFAAVQSRSSVLSPIAQLLWMLPNREKDQIRLGLSRTYKAPLAADLVPRRYTVNYNNGPTNADAEGNPNLRPELAWGLDLAYESYFTKNGFAGVSAYVRQVDSVTTRTLFQDGTEWVTSLTNNGSAKVYGIEIELKAPLHQLIPMPFDVDVRVNGARNFSSVENIPGPYNRLSSQVPTSANLGFDYHPADALSFGTNYGYKGGALASLTPALITRPGPVRTLDLYGNWKTSANANIRMSVSNLLHQDWNGFDYYYSDEGETLRTTDRSSSTLARLSFEYRFE
jgi:outer membrane receptor for ferrienterochelin and colicin